ncbi:MAG: hypothetical protein MUC97_07695 [Bernardetiaceae bacterium]|jgi:hypothetical protein|nr:hypothetical protein [Bernardetiaceae bacterium]
MHPVFSSRYLKVDHCAPLPLLYAKWTPQASLMTEGEFVDHVEQFVALVKSYRTEAFLINCQEGHFLLRPDLQEWHDQEIVPQYLAQGVRRIGVVVAQDDFYTNLAMELTFGEELASQLSTRFFADPDSAWAWASKGLPVLAMATA